MFYDIADPYENAYTRSVYVRNLNDRIRIIVEKIKEGKRDPLVRKLAADAVRNVAPRDWLGEVAAIFEFVRQNVRYTLDVHGLDTYQRARRTLQLGIGDCDDQVILLGAMLQSIGYPIALKVIESVDSDHGWNHIYLLVGVPPSAPQRWIPLDPTVSQPMGWELPPQYVRRSAIYYVD